MKLRITAFWQAVLVVIAAWLVFRFAFPPVMPKTLMIQFMTITVVGVLLYFSFEDARWKEFQAPVLAVLRSPGQWPARWFLLIGIPALAAFVTWDNTRPSLDPPVELRQAHPAPPSKLKVFNKTFDLKTLENPVRAQILDTLGNDADAAMQVYNSAVAAGSQIYFENCFYCHGDLLDGDGPYASGFNPLPINFQDVGTIAQLQEAFLFWRITTGGPGLPKEGTPWNSAMPVWHEMLTEEEVWNIIMFLYDYVGQVPRMWDAEMSKAATGIKERALTQRAQMDGNAIYQFRCAACHGETGTGDGPAADRMYPRPRDFSLALFKYKTTPGTLLPSDQDLFATIKYGLSETGMPAWETLLNDSEIKSLIPVIKRFDFTAAWAPDDAEDEDFDDDGFYTKDDFRTVEEVEPVDGQVAYSDESIGRGKEVFEAACNECHGAEGRGNITSGKKLEDDWGFRIWPRNLTKPWTWRVTEVAGDEGGSDRDSTIKRIYQRLSIGIPGTPMPAHREVEEGNKDPISLEDRWHVSNYVYSLRESGHGVPESGSVLKATRISGSLPGDAESSAWQSAQSVSLRLVPNLIKEDRLFTPLSNTVSVRALYNDTDIAFLLEVDDRTESRPGIDYFTELQDAEKEMFADAFAIQFPKEGAFETTPVVEKPLYRHGDARHGTTIWYWNAGSVDPVVKSAAALMDATGPNKGLSRREGKLDSSGNWKDGRWRVVMTRPRVSQDDDVLFDEGRFIPVSFANWDGSNGEVGSQHTLTTWYWLLLPPKVNAVGLYGFPAVVFVLLLLGGILLVRSQRKYA